MALLLFPNHKFVARVELAGLTYRCLMRVTLPSCVLNTLRGKLALNLIRSLAFNSSFPFFHSSQ